MSTRTTNYGLYKPDPTDPFEDFRAEHNANMDIIDANLGGGGGGGGHTIVDENGSDMASEPKLQFTGNVNVTDDSVNGKTIVDIPNSSGSGHTIIDPNGSSMIQRSGLKFTGNVNVTDDSTNNETIIDILGGGAGNEYYLGNGLIGSDGGTYVTVNLLNPLVNGIYLICITDGANIGFTHLKWKGNTQTLNVSTPVGGQLQITSTTAGLIYYSGAWRNIYCDILLLAEEYQ